MAATLRWFLRLFALLAMLLFAALMVIFVIVTVDQFGEKQYVSDSVAGLPPVYVLTAILVPFCGAFVAGFWFLFYDSFRDRTEEYDDDVVPMSRPFPPPPPPLRERIRAWADQRLPRPRGES